MSKITDIQIQKKNKTRANVYIDGEYAFALEMLTVMKLGLKIGADVSRERLDEAVFDSERSVAFEKAMNYLSRSMKTRRQMRDYLTGKGYSAEVTDAVLERLAEYKYIDDDTYARAYVEQNSSTKGERRIKQELQQKGIASSVAESFCVISSDAAQDCAQTLADKYMRGKPRDLKTLQKLQRYLLSRGYDYDVINSVSRKYKTDD